MYFENVFICKNAQEIICTICLVVNYEFAHILKVLRLDKTAIWLEEKRAGEIFDAAYMLPGYSNLPNKRTGTITVF